MEKDLVVGVVLKNVVTFYDVLGRPSFLFVNRATHQMA